MEWSNKKIPISDKSPGMQINPLAWLTADFYRNQKGDKPDLNNFVLYSARIANGSMDYFLSRYEIIRKEVEILYLPGHQYFLEKIEHPIRLAMVNFLIKNPLGTIALCGTSAEMLAVFLLNVWNKIVNETYKDEKQQEELFGRSFEKLGQERRINILFTLKIIDMDTKDKLKKIKQIRNQYLHWYSKNFDDIDSDALIAFKNLNQIIVNTLGLETVEKKGWLNEHVYEYLKQTDVYDYEKMDKFWNK